MRLISFSGSIDCIIFLVD